MSSQTDISRNAMVYLFGDQTVPVLDSLRSLLLVQHNAPMKAFLDEALSALRLCISTLPATERLEFPQIESLGLLLEAMQKGPSHAALDSVCLCIYQIAYYMELVAQNHQHHPPMEPSFILGFCTGSLAAAAIACSTTISDVGQLGVQAVIVAFRIGMLVRRRATILGYPESQSWSAVITGTQEQEIADAVEQFRSSSFIQNLPWTSQAYISAVSPTAVTVSGPPNVLDELLLVPPLSTKMTHRVPVHGPYHADRVYSEVDLHHLGTSLAVHLKFLDRAVHTPMLSCASSSSIMSQTTFGGILEEVITSILLQQVRIDRVVDGLFENLAAASVAAATLVSVGSPVPVTATLSATLSRKGITAHIGKTLETAAAEQPESGTARQADRDNDNDANKVAIIGFSGRFPEADGLAEFWEVLRKGLDVHKPIPADRFDVNTHYDPTGQRKNTSQVQYGCWLKDASLFDPQFFHLSPREAAQTDPAQRLALLTAYEAMEMAGFVPDRTASSQRNRVGAYYGTTSNDWGEVNSSQDVDTYYIPGANRAFIPGRINYFFKFSGPSIAVDTACSSSLAAINIALSSLLRGDCDTAIAGGTNVISNPDNFAGLDRGHFLSRTGNCKTFDNDADGYCRADGVGTVLLKRLSDAIADNDPVFGVVLGAHTNHSAESVSITRPLADAQEYLFAKLLSESGVRPHDVGYIEMHGTGTQAGDAVEMRSVLNTFAWDYSRPADKGLFLGSVKANVGHGESASGVTALIKVLLMMKLDKIPPHCGIKSKINEGFPKDLDRRRVKIVLDAEGAEWPRPRGGRGKRRAFVNNFSAAGGNTAMLLEDAPLPVVSQHDKLVLGDDVVPPRKHVVTVSARSNKSLKQNLLTLADFIGQSIAVNTCSSEEELLAQISYTTTARRMHHNRRVALVTDGLQHLKRSLLESASSQDPTKPIPSNDVSVGFLFTGQGAQETGMARGLYQNFDSFRSDIDDFDATARLQGLPSILPLVDGSVPVDELSSTVVQLGTCIVQIALSRLWINLGARPQYVMGHSLGEYAALHISGVLSISDTIHLCGRRAALLEEKCKPDSHGMLVVMASESKVKQVIAATPSLGVACLNGPEDTVISGPIVDIDAACEKFTELRYKFHKLLLPFAFHSSQVDPILDELEDLARRVDFRAPTIPFVSTLLGTVITSAGVVGPEYIRRHCREPVNFLGAVREAEQQNMIRSNAGVCVEIGSHALLTRMTKNICGPDVRCFASLRRGERWCETLPQSMAALHSAGVPLNWEDYHRGFSAVSAQKVVELPSYAWDLSSHWMQYKYDWCLTKGDAPVETTAVPAAAVAQGRPLRLSDSCQEVVEQTIGDDKSSVVVQSDFHDPGLLPVAEQHRVNGLTLCPSTLYADVAYTLSKYLLEQRFSGKQEYMPDICDMAAEKALIVGNDCDEPQLFRGAMAADWDSMAASMEIYSVGPGGKRTTLHARCNVRFYKPEVYEEYWRRHVYLIERSIQRLEQGVSDGSVHKMGRGMAYKVFSSAVQYGQGYQGMQEVWFDSEGLEATGKVLIPSSGTKGQFALSPFCCDSLGHISGFVMNANDSLDLQDNIYVNHGWRNMRFSAPYMPDVQYRTYVKMQPVGKDDSVYSGDVHVLRDGKIVGLCEQVTFQKVPRRVLEMLLPSPSNKNKGKKQQQDATSHAPTKAKPVIPVASPLGILLPPSSPSTSSRASTMPSTPGREMPEPVASGVLQQALQVIAEEIGLDAAQLEDEAAFADLGVDSLMSLTILGTLREDLDLDVPASLFVECPTVLSLKRFLLASISPSSPEPSTPATSVSGGSEDEAQAAGLPAKPAGSRPSVPASTSVILQGTKTSPKTLFLFPDGAGSATSYVTLPPISPLVRVYGLNSPYLKSPRDFRCGLGDITDSYLAEVRRRQPAGPYSLAGWSAGGVSAFDAAQRLVAQGEVVESLVFIDSPNPVGLGKLPPRMYTFLESSGVFGAFEPSGSDPTSSSGPTATTTTDGGAAAAAAPAWLYQHFLVFIEALDKYRPAAFARGTAPRTTIIWARDGVCKDPGDARPERQPGDPRGMAWLLENRTDFGPNGWDEFLGGRENITTHAVEGANHFTMMREPVAGAVVGLVREAMGV